MRLDVVANTVPGAVMLLFGNIFADKAFSFFSLMILTLTFVINCSQKRIMDKIQELD